MDNSLNRTIDPPRNGILPDGKLVEQARQDPRAFGKVYDRYLDPIYRYVYNRTGNPADAEDITSQTFLAALEGLPKYRENGYFAAWLFAIARRKVADHYRSRRSQVDLDEVQFIWIDHEMDGSLIRNQRKEALQKVLQALPEQDKELLRLRYLAELNFSDIARLLKRSEPAVKKAYYRLIDRIQQKMEVPNE